MDIPILIITYNRFDYVHKILNQLNENNCKHVYIAVDDYPRDSKTFDEIEQVLVANRFRYQLLKWSKNIGCENNVLESIKWFFEHVESGIILEDDCIPTDTFFQILPQLKQGALAGQNLSFFSNYLEDKQDFFFRPSYIPFFWGWYSSREFFSKFYKFIKGNKLSLSQMSKVFSTNLSLKVRLIILINYLSFKYGKGGTSWDSVLFFYKILYKEPFYIPSYSLINNIGFGSMNSTFTHTDKMAKWCEIVTKRSKKAIVSSHIYSEDRKKDREFLDIYYQDYPRNFKLFITLVIKYFERKLKKINNPFFSTQGEE